MQSQTNNVVYMIVWAILLIIVAWPLAWFIAPIWVFLLPFEALIPPGSFRNGVDRFTTRRPAGSRPLLSNTSHRQMMMPGAW
jgi:hypothetical protein